VEQETRKSRRIGLPGWILIGAVLGIVVGVLLGDRCAVLEPVAMAYVMLLQSVVYPYIMCTLLHGLGQLSPERAARLFRSGWHFLLLIWFITFGVMILICQIIPAPPPPVVIDPTTRTHITKGLLELLIPANLSTDLASNYVPAVVVFCILFGIALQHFPKREGLLDILDIIRGASVTIWRWLVHLAPFAVFAMFARTAGTIDISHLQSLLFYLSLYLGSTFLLAFVILPMLISALVPMRYREVLSSLKAAFVLAAVTTISAVALPFVLEAVQKLAAQCRIDKKDSDEIIQTTLSISYPLAQLGNFFVYVFILFSASYYRIPLRLTEKIVLPFMTLLSCVGCPTSSVNAVGFLGDWLNFPTQVEAFYVETMMVTRYGQVLCSVMGFAFLTILVTMSYYGKLQVNRKRLAQSIFGGFLLFILLSWASLSLGEHHKALPDSYLGFTLSTATTQGVNVTHNPYPVLPDDMTTFQRIQKTQTLRVGYNPHVIPFCYHNRHGDLVGYDVAYAYALARALNARLAFVPFEWSELVQDLQARRFDIAMSGIYVTESRLRAVEISNPYFQSPVALIVRSEQAEDFLNMEQIKNRKNLQLAIFKDPVLEPMVHRLFPGAKVNVCHDYDELTQTPNFDAALWTLAQARVWAQAHIGFTAVKPEGLAGVEVFGYLMPPDSPEFIRFVNHWLQLKEADGFQAYQNNYWISGKKRMTDQPRWCLLDSWLNEAGRE